MNIIDNRYRCNLYRYLYRHLYRYIQITEITETTDRDNGYNRYNRYLYRFTQIIKIWHN